MPTGHYKRKPRTIETRRKLSLAFSGNKHPNWKGGLSSSRQKFKNSLDFKLWRKAVFERDNYTCVWCKYKSKNAKPADIHADHIKPYSEYPEFRLAIDNGRTLCVPCHQSTNTWGVHKIK